MRANWHSLFKNLFSPSPKRRRRPVGFVTPECFEDRRLLSAVIVDLSDDTHTGETGGTVTFTVRLDAQPTANVEIPISSSNVKEGKVSVAKLTFTPANFATAQTVTVTGVNDFVDDGDQPFTVKIDKLKSNDVSYKNLNPDDLTLTNDDDDSAGIVVTPTIPLVTTEKGGTATFNVKLSSQPLANVLLRMENTDITEGTRPNPITLGTGNWSKGINVSIKGLNDFVDDGDQNYQITFAVAESNDPNYRGQAVDALSFVNQDDDTAGLLVTPQSGLIVNEGSTKVVTVKLNSQPLSNVTIIPTMLEGDDQARVKLNPVAPLIFTPANWNAAKTIIIEGIQDPLVEGLTPFTLSVETESDDPLYAGLGKDVVGQVKDDKETAGIIFSPGSLPAILEGASTSFTVRLKSQPAEDVLISFGSGAGAALQPANEAEPEALVFPELIIFSTDDWAEPQEVIVEGLRDGVLDGTKTFRFTAVSESTVLPYNGLTKSFSIQVMDADELAVFDGDYEGSYRGTVRGFGVSAPANGSVFFTVTDGVIEVIEPEAGTGTVAKSGSSTFSAANGATFGARFSGKFTLAADDSVSASGSWTVTLTGFSGSGTWTAQRI